MIWSSKVNVWSIYTYLISFIIGFFYRIIGFNILWFTTNAEQRRKLSWSYSLHDYQLVCWQLLWQSKANNRTKELISYYLSPATTKLTLHLSIILLILWAPSSSKIQSDGYLYTASCLCTLSFFFFYHVSISSVI